MPRRKAARNCTILPWLSAKADGKEGRFIQIGNSLLLSDAFQALTPGAARLYLCMAMESGGHRDFVFPSSICEKKYGISQRSFARYLKELEDAGFIAVSSGKNTWTKNEFSFSFKWKEKSSEKNEGYGYM